MTQWLGLTIGSGVRGLTTGISSPNNLISILAILLFTAIYSTTGGMRSVVTTDVMQLSLAMPGTFLYALIIIGRVG